MRQLQIAAFCDTNFNILNNEVTPIRILRKGEHYISRAWEWLIANLNAIDYRGIGPGGWDSGTPT